MTRHLSPRRGKRDAAGSGGFRRRPVEWHGRFRCAAAMAVLAAVTAPSWTLAQVGQSAMSPAEGIVNSAAGRIMGPGNALPGVMYYGVNGADRGLGYVGSYMTLGGFIPAAEDDLGGFWSADLRGHLSTYGGFFSNVGAVRKQFIGGTLLGVGVYWDYDGDMNQYPDTVLPVGTGAPYVFAGGQTYNQVGISGEWLTDYGNIRSNGYIPVGSTAQLADTFVGNFVLCGNGVNAALGGADLEVGAYIPALADWAGMVSVGGYALGNTRYQMTSGAGAVPWFGGVYTRLDLTLARNWDFSLQANDDSYFNWTGFARLTYRMGSSRRRNVPDQVEQPMMRNEHIVRAHQAPDVAINPATGTPWLVYHVDNTAAPGGNGSAEAPFATVTDVVNRPAAEQAPYDIVYLHAYSGASAAPYVTPATGFTFSFPNQMLVGQGTGMMLPSLGCTPTSLAGGGSATVYPVLLNPVGPAVVVDQPGTVVDHVQINAWSLGISDGAGIGPGTSATINDVIIVGNGGPFQRGVQIDNSRGTFNFTNVRLSNLTNDGFVVNAANASVTIANSSLTDVARTGVLVNGSSAVVAIANTTFAGSTMTTAVDAAGTGAAVSIASSSIDSAAGNAVVASGANTGITITSSTISRTLGSALVASGASSTITGSAVTITGSSTTASGSATVVGSGAPAILLAGAGSQVTIRSSTVSDVSGVGAQLDGANSKFTMNNASRIQRTGTGSDGILVTAPTAFAIVTGKSVLSDITGNGIHSLGGSVQVADATIRNITGNGILASGVSGATKCVWVQGATITDIAGNGIDVTDSNLRVERLVATDPTSQATTIARVDGLTGISAFANANPPADSRVLIDSVVISAVRNGILAGAGAAGPPPATLDFTATNNRIATTGGGTGIGLSGVWNPYLPPALPVQTSLVNALMTGNVISTGVAGNDILLTTANGPTQTAGGLALAGRPLHLTAGNAAQLSTNNSNARVVENPAPDAPNGILTSVFWGENPANVLTPPPAPAPPP